VQPAVTAKQDVLGGPSADAPQFEQARTDIGVAPASQPFQIDIVAFDSAGKRDERPDLLTAETDVLIPRWRKPQDVAGRRKDAVTTGNRA
jgi:hypothetical protein